MLLMIDNYDSFTYNLVQYFGELGQEVIVHRNDQITVREIEKLILNILLFLQVHALQMKLEFHLSL